MKRILAIAIGCVLLFSNAQAQTSSADLNNDGKVDVQDLSRLLSNWGKTTRPVEDINQDGNVNVTDLGILLNKWGTVSSPPAPPAPPPPASAGCTKYVATSGSDSNSGSQSAPWKTIQKAAALVNPGDVVCVGDGVYTGGSENGPIVRLARSGTASSRITFRSLNKWGAKLDGRNNFNSSGFEIRAAYVRIEGFELYGTQSSALEVYTNVAHHIELLRNHVHHTGRYCTDTSNGRNASFVGGGAHDVLVDGNLFHDIGRYAPGENGCSPSTAYYQNHDHGVYIAEADDVTVTNNIFYNFKRGWPIQRYSSAGYTASRIYILNNTFAFENPYRSGHIIMATPARDSKIENNIFYDPNNAAISFYDASFPNLSVKNNVTYGGVIRTGSPTNVTFSGNLDNTDPMLADPLRFDFHLKSGSPAIDSGLPQPLVTSDHDGAARPKGTAYDRGAYEF